MAQVLVCFILVNVFIATAAMASSDQEKVSQIIARRLGAPTPTPSSKETSTISGEKATAASEQSKSGSEHHRPFDKSVAGGGVILGGLATTFLVAIFCYIRATRRHSNTSTAPETPAQHQLP